MVAMCGLLGIALMAQGAAPPRCLKLSVKRSALRSYTIEPPDVLTLNPVNLVAKPPDSGEDRATQQIRGEHLVRPDGTIGLGCFGSVFVTGFALEEAKVAIERHLSQYFKNPDVAVDVLHFNSKVFYVITDGTGEDEQVIRLPSTGNETVLDAIAALPSAPEVVAKKKIWVARPAPNSQDSPQILPVRWESITKDGNAATNYLILPGDRVYAKSSWCHSRRP